MWMGPRYAALTPRARLTHEQPSGEVCESAELPDGRVIRCVGDPFGTFRPQEELRKWLQWLGVRC